jgi:hypothetical protein
MLQFEHEFHKEQRLVIVFLGIAVGGILLAAALRLTGPTWMHWAQALVAFASVLSGIVLAIICWLRYRSLGIVKEKSDRERKQRQLGVETQRLQAAVSAANRTRDAITQEEMSALSDRTNAHQQLLQGLATRRNELGKSAEAELANALKNLQDRYISDGLTASEIASSEIDGVGPKLKEKLVNSGIANAQGVSYSRVSSIQGFGEAKTQAVVGWRGKVEERLEASKPVSLPPEIEDPIRKKHAETAALLDSEERAAGKSSADDQERIRQLAVERHVSNDKAQAEAQAELTSVGNLAEGIAAELARYGDITYQHFLGHCLPLASEGSGGTRRAALLGMILIFLIGVCGQSGAGLAAIRGIAIDSIPTATPTLTPSFTPTSSRTPTGTLTPTITNTPTITETPTQTSTSTITLTPTRTSTSTLTGTVTGTPSRTPAPTSTRRPTATKSYFSPGPGSGATALCKDGTYSYSAIHQGTCSRHGGVAVWYK